MKQLALGVALLAAAAAPMAASAATRPPLRPAERKDWTRAVTVTPEGGFRMGNPKAPVKLVEYGSLACPHCRHFEQTGYKPLLENYVRTGRLSYEFRNLLINGPDISVTLLTRCAGPRKFFAMSQYVYSAQPQWQRKLEEMSAADKAALDTLTDQQRIVRYAEIGGLGQVAARFGITSARAKQCLSDPKATERLLALTKQAQNGGIRRTPTFLINGKMTDAATWEELEPLIRQAGERG